MAKTDADAEKAKHVRNLWVLMLYMSYFDYEKKKQKTGIADNPDKLADLIAEIFTEIVEMRLRRNLNFSYQPQERVLRRVRGRIDILKTERHQLLQKGQVACKFEELSIDTPRNRFVRDALEKIASELDKQKSKKLANRCRELALRLRRLGVNGIAPPYREMEHQRYGFNDKNDEKMVFAAMLAYKLALPDGSAGNNELLIPNYKGKFYNLYEQAIAAFYRKVLGNRNWSISVKNKMRWAVAEHDPEAEKRLPTMVPDVVLNKKDGKRNIILDTKFHKIMSVEYDEDIDKDKKARLNRGNIFQIYTYLGSQKGKKDSPVKENAEGLLLYPAIGGGNVTKDFQLGDFKVRFAAVDLNKNLQAIRKRLIEIIEQ